MYEFLQAEEGILLGIALTPSCIPELPICSKKGHRLREWQALSDKASLGISWSTLCIWIEGHGGGAYGQTASQDLKAEILPLNFLFLLLLLCGRAGASTGVGSVHVHTKSRVNQEKNLKTFFF